ncbi:uncharacterized protein LOC115924188 [Strongylocentrotus purpuratus]|uniref:Uncharacterized protein n=1 Tax=Strongylocentrotus purpuratus TaxID=7668 RepID=A0A7M7NWD0_STRPU|nr:uncharacterized protein LOC115924188 [Strongylocentrotus purpuratus]
MSVGANRDELPMAILKSFYSHGNDDKAYSSDDFERYKRENCCELRGGRLNFYEKGEPDHNTTTTVMKVERRRGTNILILRCGPGGRTVIFLEFDSMRLTGEWQEALCRCTGQPYDPTPALRRVRSEITAAANKWKRRALTRSTFPDIVDEQVDPDSEQVDPSSETPQEAPLAPPVTLPEGPSGPVSSRSRDDDLRCCL